MVRRSSHAGYPDGHGAGVAAHRPRRRAEQGRGVDPAWCGRGRRGGPCRRGQDPARPRGAGEAGWFGRLCRLGSRQHGRPADAARCFRGPARRPHRRCRGDHRPRAGPARRETAAGPGRRRRPPAGRAFSHRAAPRGRTPAGAGPGDPSDRGAGPRHRDGAMEGRSPPTRGPGSAGQRRDRRPGRPGARRAGRFRLRAQVVGADPGQPVVPAPLAGR